MSTPATSANGEGRKYAAAVALGLAGIQGAADSVDFLHPRLAPPKQQRIPRWALTAALSVIMVIAMAIWAYTDLQNMRAKLATDQAKYKAEEARLKVAEEFVNKVSFAQAWHGGNPRYLACLQDLTVSIPEDYQTYVTNIVIQEVPKPQVTSSTTKARAPANETRPLSVHLFGKTADHDKVSTLLTQLQRVPTFSDVTLTNSNSNPRERDWSFAVTFTYTPAKAAH